MDNNIQLDVDGFNIVYAKKRGTPKNIKFNDRLLVTKFLMEELNNIDILCINDNIIDINALVNNNTKLSRYLKLNNGL